MYSGRDYVHHEEIISKQEIYSYDVRVNRFHDALASNSKANMCQLDYPEDSAEPFSFF